MSTLDDYENSKFVVTHLDADDWHWYFVNNDLVWEGHTNIRCEILEAILEAMFDEGEVFVQSEWIDGLTAERMSLGLKKLSDLIEKYGYDTDMNVFWLGKGKDA